METLRLGSKGENVEKWQAFLRGVGLYFGKIDGDFGPMTREATEAFQSRHGLLDDGIAGNRTLGEAMRLGFAFVDDSGALDPVEAPPRPPFPALGAQGRAETFGDYSFVSAPVSGNPEAIQITSNWLKESIVSVEIPQLAGVKGAPASRRVQFHRLVAPRVAELFARWEEAGLVGSILTWDGSFVPRFIRGSRTVLSSHAHGSAFDINARWNGLGAVPARSTAKGSVHRLVAAAHALGFYWGGHFSRPDGMHFELARL
jgi:hypothetical protein